jgi:hypothetical protein
LQLAGCLLILLFELEEEGRMLFWNICDILLDYMATRPRRWSSSFSSVSVWPTEIYICVMWFWTC